MLTTSSCHLQVTNVRAALSALMDNPHPLDILGDPAAYGNEGAISRYHNPDHYTKSLGGTNLATTANACQLHHFPSA
jgi:hypothetical protein